MKKSSVFLFFTFLVLSGVGCLLAQQRYELNSKWYGLPVRKVSASGNEISQQGFSIKNWKPATVPGTVLTTMLNNGEIPDPFYGMNNEKIPDIYTVGREYYTYWFVKDFEEKAKQGEEAWLTFRGINYSVDIFLNGKKVNRGSYKGMFLRKSFNITKQLAKNGKNRLAVLVHPADFVGNPNGGQCGDGTIARGVANQYAAGWDWIQPIRDRNTGIWDKVFIEKTGVVNLKNPHIVTLVEGKRIPGADQKPALIKVSAELHNTQNKPIEGILQYRLNDKMIKKQLTLPANATVLEALPIFEIQHPKLWWPSGYGNQNLYTIDIQFLINNVISDSEKVSFGVREIQTNYNKRTRSKEIYVNGQKIFIKGGNWIISDAMLRFSKERYDAEVRFHRDMNLNLIRIWGGALLERPEFYESCDKYGLLVMQDFWMSGDCNGRWNDPMKKEDQWTRRQYPDDHQLFISSAIDGIKMLRNHASLAIWCGGNEITPPQDILHALKDSILPELDGTRWFVDYSNSNEMSHNFKGGNGDGPYGIQDINTFWAERTYPFNSEVGSVGTGDAVSLKRFLPKKNQVIPEITQGTLQVKDSVWAYHKYIAYNGKTAKYGTPKNMEDFAKKAQLVNYNQYRGLIEGFSAHMWDWYTGVIIWKTQNPWTALRGQMYDYYLDPNAGLYGLRTGGEPVHAMYDPVKQNILIVNHGFKAREMLLEVTAYDINGKKTKLNHIWSYVEPSSVKLITSIKKDIDKMSEKKGLFLYVQLLNLDKALISDNFYWLPDAKGNYSGLQKMEKASLQTIAKQVSDSTVILTLINNKKHVVSFFNRISLVNKSNKKRLLPTFYSDNYISIPPGEKKIITLEYNKVDKKSMQIEIEGWNTNQQYVEITR